MSLKKSAGGASAPSPSNPLGDLPITDPQAMRALAHPVRLAVLSHLQRHGPATATQLSPHVGATPSVTSWHLRHLASFGLVRDADPDEVPGDRRQRWWKAMARGFRIEPGDGPEADAALEVIGGQLLQTAGDQIAEWATGTWPRLEPDWRRAVGIANTRVRLTTDEVAEINRRVDELLGPYVTREQAPDEARAVRIIRHVLPEAAPQ
jgi:DNA-binding transcriptional ArsR family regulator